MQTALSQHSGVAHGADATTDLAFFAVMASSRTAVFRIRAEHFFLGFRTLSTYPLVHRDSIHRSFYYYYNTSLQTAQSQHSGFRASSTFPFVDRDFVSAIIRIHVLQSNDSPYFTCRFRALSTLPSCIVSQRSRSRYRQTAQFQHSGFRALSTFPFVHRIIDHVIIHLEISFISWVFFDDLPQSQHSGVMCILWRHGHALPSGALPFSWRGSFWQVTKTRSCRQPFATQWCNMWDVYANVACAVANSPEPPFRTVANSLNPRLSSQPYVTAAISGAQSIFGLCVVHAYGVAPLVSSGVS